MNTVLQPLRRALTEAERRTLAAKIRTHTDAARRTSRRYVPVVGGTVFALWLWTILASDSPRIIVTLFWLIVGGGIAFWVRRDIRRNMGQVEQRLESALRRNTAEVYDVRASSFAELEEIDDEGACYAFEIEADRLLFIAGQEFYAGARFPSLDFSLVYVLDEDGRTAYMFIEKRGAKAAPARRISAAVKRRLELPEHLEMRTGTIEKLESLLEPRRFGQTT